MNESPEDKTRRFIEESTGWLEKLPPEKRQRAREKLMSIGLDLMTREQLVKLRVQVLALPFAGVGGSTIDMIDGQIALLDAGVHRPLSG